jgi:hypothetical protein
MRSGPARRAGLVVIALFVSIPLCRAGDGRVLFVPWKVLEPGVSPAAALLTVYWIPSSPDELRKSDLVTSRTLAMVAARCVNMQVIRADDLERIEKLGVAGHLPLALILDGDGEIARVGNNGGTLRLSDVENMVRLAVDRRELACDALLDAAKQKIAAGERPAAIDMYRKVFDQRCAFPRQGREAQRALKRMRALR